MALSSCAVVFFGILTIGLSVAAGFAISALYTKCAERFKLPNYSTQSAFGGALATMLLVIFVIGANTKEWKPCGQDSVAKALQNTPAQPVVASLAHNCGCCGHDK